MSFIFKRVQEMPDLIVVETDAYSDSRGFFLETYKHSDFKDGGISETFLQENFSHSIKNVIRGLHYQEGEFAQGKLVRCVYGTIFDVAVDIRTDSATFGKWFGIELSESNHKQLYVPPGFAHGFAVISEDAGVSYMCTKEYCKTQEGGIVWNDRTIGISWPIENPIVSEKDAGLPKLEEL